MAQKIKKLQPFDCEVNDKQNYKLLNLVSEVCKKGSKAVDELRKESDQILGKDNVLRDAWQQDISERLEFENDQHNSVIVWLLMVLSIYMHVHSNKEQRKSVEQDNY